MNDIIERIVDRLNALAKRVDELGRCDVPKRLTGTATWDPASLTNGSTATTTVTVTGAASGDIVLCSFTSIAAGGWQLTGAVTSANTVTVTLTNHTGGTVDLGSGTVKAIVT